MIDILIYISFAHWFCVYFSFTRVQRDHNPCPIVFKYHTSALEVDNNIHINSPIQTQKHVGNIVIDGKGGSTQAKEAALKQRKEKEAHRKQ